MAKKVKDIGLGSKPKQPSRKEVFETAYPKFSGKPLEGKVVITSTPTSKNIGNAFKELWDEAEEIPRQRFENRIKKNKKTKK